MLQDTQDFANSGPLPLAPADLDELARWVPKKEMALLIDLCERAWRDPDLARPALLLCWAYGQKIARMLDQDPFPSLTHPMTDMGHGCQVMADEQIAHPQRLLQMLKLVHDLRPDRHVKRRDRLVEHD